MTYAIRASDLVGKRVQEIRRRRGWTAAQLAKQCAAVGATDITESVLANIETGRRQNGRRRRDVTIDEVLALALALNVPPVLLFLPVGTTDELAVTPTESVRPLGALLWTCGHTGWWPRLLQQWRETAAPILLLRRFHLAETAAFRESRDTDSEAYAAALLELGRTLDMLVESGVPVPPIQTGLVEELRAEGLLSYPDEVPTYEAGDDSGGR